MKVPSQRLRILALALAALGALAACREQPPATNLVMICIDTVRYDAFLQTTQPDALDPWLESAQIYDDAFATGPWTMPSVGSALTGLYPVEHGGGRFAKPVANLDTDPPSPVAKEADTLAELLAAEGYRAAAFVAHPFFTSGLGLDQGFEAVHAAKRWPRNLEKFRRWRGRLGETERFFGYLHLMEAHNRHKAGTAALTEQLAELDAATRSDLQARASEAACRDPDNRRCLQHQLYNAQVLELRRGLAAVLQSLRDDGLLENTVVLVYSDHGEEFWEHRQEQAEAAEDPRGIFGFGHGQSLYQELLHVPVLAWVPGRPGARHADPVSLVDLVPSALDWLDIEFGTDAFSGRPLPLPGADRTRAEQERTVYASGIAYGPEKIAARAAPLKTIFTPGTDRYEYFDLVADPLEKQALAARPDVTMLFDTLVGDYLERTSSSVVASSEFDEDQIRQLKAIGYLQGVESDQSPAPEAEEPSGGKDEPVEEETP